ncbi:jg2086 [Pararge aegeria aegeria]|uniref:Jg2086 protein n=1 Tax=Pararge aegeria aegeria TaxID=348720 RepID=A0A8S4RVN0_9NEOP|nr:jg2086 [Pararge aegeria aegeria]
MTIRKIIAKIIVTNVEYFVCFMCRFLSDVEFVSYNVVFGSVVLRSVSLNSTEDAVPASNKKETSMRRHEVFGRRVLFYCCGKPFGVASSSISRQWIASLVSAAGEENFRSEKKRNDALKMFLKSHYEFKKENSIK